MQSLYDIQYKLFMLNQEQTDMVMFILSDLMMSYVFRKGA